MWKSVKRVPFRAVVQCTAAQCQSRARQMGPFAVGASVPRESRLGVLVLVPDIEKLPVAPYAPTSPQPQSSATTRAHHAKAPHQGKKRQTQAWSRWKVLRRNDGRKDAHMKRKLGLGAAPPATMSGIKKVARAAPREWKSNRATIVRTTHWVRAVSRGACRRASRSRSIRGPRARARPRARPARPAGWLGARDACARPPMAWPPAPRAHASAGPPKRRAQPPQAASAWS